MLYAYPVLLTVEKEYAQHIANMALLSYRSDAPAQSVAEKIVEQIAEKDALLWLKAQVEKVLDALNETERTLLAVKYFGKKRSAKMQTIAFSESKYFRMQARLGNKIQAKLYALGLDERTFERYFAKLELFQTIAAYIRKREPKGITEREKRWLKTA